MKTSQTGHKMIDHLNKINLTEAIFLFCLISLDISEVIFFQKIAYNGLIIQISLVFSYFLSVCTQPIFYKPCRDYLTQISSSTFYWVRHRGRHPPIPQRRSYRGRSSRQWGIHCACASAKIKWNRLKSIQGNRSLCRRLYRDSNEMYTKFTPLKT